MSAAQDMQNAISAGAGEEISTVATAPAPAPPITPTRKSPAPHHTPAKDTGWLDGGADKLEEKWPEHLPRRPSMVQKEDDPMANEGVPKYVVYNANSAEGISMVRILSEKGFRVVAVVGNAAGKRVQEMVKLKRVDVRKAATIDKVALQKAAEGCDRAFVVSRCWERFESRIEEETFYNILHATAEANVKQFVKCTFEDAVDLAKMGFKSQLVPNKNGTIFPKFSGMQGFETRAASLGIQISHVMTSYYDVEGEKKALVLMKGPNGKIVVKPFFKDQVSV